MDTIAWETVRKEFAFDGSWRVFCIPSRWPPPGYLERSAAEGPMAGDVDRNAFVAMLADRYPAIAADIDDCERGLLHLEMGALARAAQAAISDEDTAAVREHFQFIDEVYRRATPEVKNAVHVSYLERLSFEGKHGKRVKAREMLSPALQAGLRGLEAYNAELFHRGGPA